MLFEPHRPHGMSDANYISHLREMVRTLDQVRDFCAFQEIEQIRRLDHEFTGDGLHKTFYKLATTDFSTDMVNSLGKYCKLLEDHIRLLNEDIQNPEDDGA